MESTQENDPVFHMQNCRESSSEWVAPEINPSLILVKQKSQKEEKSAKQATPLPPCPLVHGLDLLQLENDP